MIPLAAHLCSRFLSTFVMFFPIEEMFLCMQEQLAVEKRCEASDLLLVVSDELQPIFLAGVVDVLDQRLHLAL